MKRKIFYIFLLCIFLFQINIAYAQNASNEASVENYQIETNSNSEDNLDLKKSSVNVYSDAAILMDSKTNTILYSKNAYEKKYPASTTKILTAIIAIEKCNLDDIVTVTKSAISAIPSGYSSAYLSENEQISVNDLLTVFLVHSANDAGYILAEHISGSIDNFANLMNEKANEIGCKNTHFTNPSGIHDVNHYTTAYDLALIAKYCMQNTTFRNIVSKKTCTINSTNKFGVRSYINTNDLINPASKYYIEECIGIKTGYTSQAKNCLISAYNKNNLELICVVLGASQLQNGESSRYLDSKNLFNFGYTNFSLKTFANKGDSVYSVCIKNGSKNTQDLDLVLDSSISGLAKNSSSIPEPTITLKENLSAPIAENSIVGTISYKVFDTTYTANLLASHSVETNNTLLFGLIFLLIIIVILIFIITYFLKLKKTNKRKSKYNSLI